jgi:hypothetical protein
MTRSEGPSMPQTLTNGKICYIDHYGHCALGPLLFGKSLSGTSGNAVMAAQRLTTQPAAK